MNRFLGEVNRQSISSVSSKSSSSESESEDEDFKAFANGTFQDIQGNKINQSVINEIFEEEIMDMKDKKTPNSIKQDNSKDSSNFDDFNIDFTVMQKSNESKPNQFVVHNDMDLKDLHKAFVRQKKTKLNKLKTEEHSDSGSSISSSDDNDDGSDMEIRQGKNLYIQY